MLLRFVVAGLIALSIAVVVPAPVASAHDSDEGYDLWADCTSLPPDFEFLPIFLGSESPGFIDLNRPVTMSGQDYRALQYTRDKDFGVQRVRSGAWYGGMGSDRWPLGTIDPARFFAAFRITDWEVDGTRYPVRPSCVLTFETDDLALGLYNVWVRFNEPGVHTLRIFGRQIADFPFYAPFTFGPADPLGLDGRRVFVRGESIGDVIDQQFVHTYELQVGRADDWGGGARQQD